MSTAVNDQIADTFIDEQEQELFDKYMKKGYSYEAAMLLIGSKYEQYAKSLGE